MIPSSPGPVDLSCEAIAGDPPISYYWTGPDGWTLSPGDTDGSITVNISTYGNYTCAATNDIGTRRVNLTLFEAGKIICCISVQ